MSWNVPDTVIWTVEDQQVRIFDVSSGEFQRLNETGSAVWNAIIEGDDTIDRVVERVGDKYNASTDEQWRLVREEVTEFVDELGSTGLLALVER